RGPGDGAVRRPPDGVAGGPPRHPRRLHRRRRGLPRDVRPRRLAHAPGAAHMAEGGRVIITVSRQYAAGGSAVAKLVADALGWTLVDTVFVDAVAARAGLPREEVAEREERVPGFIERLAAALARSSPELVGLTEPDAAIPPELRLVRITESVVSDLAAR